MITFDQKIVEKIVEYFDQLNPDWPIGNLILSIISLVLCVLLVGIIGIEREKRGRSAGLRTHLLVGVASNIIMIISIYGFPAGASKDVARLAAQVITGVGFLGAGAIIHHNSDIKGLTTAGTIWVSMAIGIACGSYNFFLAIMGTSLIFIILTAFKKVETRISKKSPTVVMVVRNDIPAISKILEISKEFEYQVHGVTTAIYDEKNIELTFRVTLVGAEGRVNEYINRLESDTQAVSVHLLNHF